MTIDTTKVTKVVYMSSKILQLTVGSRGSSKSEKEKYWFLQPHIVMAKWRLIYFAAVPSLNSSYGPGLEITDYLIKFYKQLLFDNFS